MARLPIPETTVAPQQGRSPRGATPSDFAFLPNKVSEGIKLVTDAARLRQIQADGFDVQKTAAEAGAHWLQDLQTRENAAPLGAEGFTDQVLEDFDEWKGKLLNDKAQAGLGLQQIQKLELKMDGLRQRLQERAISFQARSSGEKLKVDTSDLLVTYGQSATANPADTETLLSEWEETVETLPANVTAVFRNRIKDDGRKSILTSAARGLAEQTPRAVIEGLGGSLGGSSGYYAAIRRVESGGNDRARNPRSSATGRYQFTRGTWKQLMEDHPELGLTAGGLTDPAQQEKAIREFTAQNERVLRGAGIPATSANLYAAHFLGAGGASAVLTAPAAQSLEELVGAEVIESNPFLKGMAVADFKSWAVRKVGSAAAAVPADGKTGNFILDQLDPAQRRATLAAAETALNRQRAESRAELQVRTTNAEAALLSTGEFDGPMPTEQEFLAAYDPIDAQQKWEAFQATRAVGENVAEFKTLPTDEILSRVEALEPGDTSDPAFAVKVKAHNAAQTAAQRLLKQRADDPAGYVAQKFPAVAEAVDALQEAEPRDRQQAMSDLVSQMDAAYDTLGTPPKQRVYLSAQSAVSVVDALRDPNASFRERTGAALSAVFSTDDPETQTRVFEQLVTRDNSFAKFQSAFEAHGRGDRQAAMRLFEAGMHDASKLPANTDTKSTEISERIREKVFAEGSIGDIAYGFSSNIVSRAERASRDVQIMSDAVRLNMARNGGNLDQAVDQTIRDIFGPVKALSMGSIKAVVPEDVNVNDFMRGADQLRADVRTALESFRTSDDASDVPADQRGNPAVAKGMDDAAIDEILATGVWANHGTGFAFYDTASGLAVPGPDGGPMVFTHDQVRAAAASGESEAGFVPRRFQ